MPWNADETCQVDTGHIKHDDTAQTKTVSTLFLILAKMLF